jgi:hypothetical protein
LQSDAPGGRAGREEQVSLNLNDISHHKLRGEETRVLLQDHGGGGGDQNGGGVGPGAGPAALQPPPYNPNCSGPGPSSPGPSTTSAIVTMSRPPGSLAGARVTDLLGPTEGPEPGGQVKISNL